MKLSQLIIPTLLISMAGLSPAANRISESQLKFIKQYAKQANTPKPEDMLLNTDPEPDLGKGFTSLYNGKDLEGWTVLGGVSTFEPKGEAIAGTCVPGASTYLTTVRNDYSDFIFTAEIKWEVDDNSGIQFRSAVKGKGEKKTAAGPQAEMEGFSKDRGWSGGIYGQDCGGWYYPLWLDAHKEAREALKPDQWNRITIMAKGADVKTWINGIPAAYWKDPQYLKGFFSLQIHSGKQGVVLFRNIKVKELK